MMIMRKEIGSEEDDPPKILMARAIFQTKF